MATINDHSSLIECDHRSPCMVCMTPTYLVDTDFCASVCSDECLNILWNEFDSVNEELGPPAPFDLDDWPGQREELRTYDGQRS